MKLIILYVIKFYTHADIVWLSSEDKYLYFSAFVNKLILKNELLATTAIFWILGNIVTNKSTL